MQDTEKVFYPCCALNTKLHIVGLDSMKTLCGISPFMHWQMKYMGEVYPVLGSFLDYDVASKGPGFYIGKSFAPQKDFCKKCYASLKKVFL